MTILTITAKGQVTLKQDLLKHLGVSPGEKIEADKLPDGRIVVRMAPLPTFLVAWHSGEGQNSRSLK